MYHTIATGGFRTPLKAIREAAKIKVTPELRDEAVAALVLPDIEPLQEWEGCPEGTLIWACDANFERFARMDQQGRITVCRRSGDAEEDVARLEPAVQPRVLGLMMSADGRFLACGHSGEFEGVAGAVRIWKLDGPKPTVHLDEPAGMYLYALAFHSDGKGLAIGHPDGGISVYDLETKQLRQRLKIDAPPNSLAFHPTDNRLAVACNDSVRVLDLASGNAQLLRLPGIDSWSFGLAWHPEGRVLAATSDDKKIHLFDVNSGDEARSPLEGHTESGIFMAFNHKGDRLISTGFDWQTRLWDVATGRLLLTMPGDHGGKFSRDDSMIGPQRSGTKLRMWRVADGRELRTIRRATAVPNERIHLPVLDREGRVFAAASDRGLVFFELDTGMELAFVPFTNFCSAIKCLASLVAARNERFRCGETSVV
jgi:hypothetical protein